MKSEIKFGTKLEIEFSNTKVLWIRKPREFKQLFKQKAKKIDQQVVLPGECFK